MIQQNNDHLAIAWDANTSSGYHWIWLRDSCECSDCMNSHCRQKYYDPATLPIDIRPKAVSQTGDDIVITWQDGHVSRYGLQWMRRHDYSKAPAKHDAPAPIQRVPWHGNANVESGTYSYSDVVHDDDALRRALTHLFEFGLIVIVPQGIADAGFEPLCERLAGFVDRSYFGEYFDLAVKPDDQTDSVSFSTKQLPLHTDIPYYLTPPDYQFLFGLDVSANCALSGKGRTRFVDGLRAAQMLREAEPAAFDVLSRTEVTYRAQYPWAGKIYINKTSIIQIDDQGRIGRLANNPSKMFFEGIEFQSMLPLYRAYNRFKDLLQESDCSYAHAWRKGDMIVFDNRRIFHGRDSFGVDGITRTLRGGYFREVELLARYRYLSDLH